jgi:hypothetical protein
MNTDAAVKIRLAGCRLCRAAIPVAWLLGPVDLDVPVGGRGDGMQVWLVRADHEVVAAEGSFDDAGVHDVAGGGGGGEWADRAGPAVVEGFDGASGE